MKESIKIAIYSRKSKFSDKGDSVGNQVELAKEYINLHYPKELYNVKIMVYEDEGFSGGSFKRPNFQNFLIEERKNPFDLLICYRLDRISRNIADFSSLMTEITKLGTNFVSIKEQFDTKTPMGRAMMYIASVFAQLEREVIAERIRDNMIELSKTGIWLGGPPPLGFGCKRYEKVKICEETDNKILENKTKKACMLTENEEDRKLIELIFKKYLELKALVKLETYLIQNDIKSKGGAYFSTCTLRKILTNPVYAKNDREILEFFNVKGINIFYENDGREKFDGKYGLMAYKKTKDKKNLPMSDWIIAVGLHRGYIDGKDFATVQELLEKNADKTYRSAKSEKNTVVTGLLKCKKCGSYMRPKNGGRLTKTGMVSYYYSCTLKEKSKGKKCGCANVAGHKLDNKILDIIKNTFVPNSEIYKELKKMTLKKENNINSELNILEKNYKKNEKEIRNIVEKLKYIDSDLIELINKELRILKKDNEEIKQKIEEIKGYEEEKKEFNNVETKTAKTIIDVIDNYCNSFDKLDLKTKRDILNIFVKNIYVKYDAGDEIEIELLNEELSENKKNFFLSSSNFFIPNKLSPDEGSKCTGSLVTSKNSKKLPSDSGSRCPRL